MVYAPGGGMVPYATFFMFDDHHDSFELSVVSNKKEACTKKIVHE